MKTNPALSALRHHVSGAIARGEAQAITEVPATTRPAYTPGPWAALIEGESLHGSETHLVAAGPHCMAVAEVPILADASTIGCRGKTTITAAQGRANARLIAAAPTLLEALEAALVTIYGQAELLRACGAAYGIGATLQRATEAIAKAKGGAA